MAKHNLKGLFITFEGLDGCGKSTMINLLAENLRKRNHSPRTLREPGGTPIGEEIRYTLKHSKFSPALVAKTEALLMNASRAQLVHEVILPSLQKGEIILCDRFYDSTIAYQAYGRQLNLDSINQIIDFAVGTTHPDLTFLLDISPEDRKLTTTHRKSNSKNLRDHFEEADDAFFHRVRKGYEFLAKTEPERIKQIPFIKDKQHEMLSQILSYVNPLLERKYTKN